VREDLHGSYAITSLTNSRFPRTNLSHRDVYNPEGGMLYYSQIITGTELSKLTNRRLHYEP